MLRSLTDRLHALQIPLYGQNQTVPFLASWVHLLQGFKPEHSHLDQLFTLINMLDKPL